MAAVTVNKRKFNVIGSVRQQFYNIAGATGGTQVIGLRSIKKVNVDPGTVTSAAITAGTVPGTSIITYTSSGAFTNTNVEVMGN